MKWHLTDSYWWIYVQSDDKIKLLDEPRDVQVIIWKKHCVLSMRNISFDYLFTNL